MCEIWLKANEDPSITVSRSFGFRVKEGKGYKSDNSYAPTKPCQSTHWYTVVRSTERGDRRVLKMMVISWHETSLWTVVPE